MIDIVDKTLISMENFVITSITIDLNLPQKYSSTTILYCCKCSFFLLKSKQRKCRKEARKENQKHELMLGSSYKVFFFFVSQFFCLISDFNFFPGRLFAIVMPCFVTLETSNINNINIWIRGGSDGRKIKGRKWGKRKNEDRAKNNS